MSPAPENHVGSASPSVWSTTDPSAAMSTDTTDSAVAGPPHVMPPPSNAGPAAADATHTRPAATERDLGVRADVHEQPGPLIRFRLTHNEARKHVASHEAGERWNQFDDRVRKGRRAGGSPRASDAQSSGIENGWLASELTSAPARSARHHHVACYHQTTHASASAGCSRVHSIEHRVFCEPAQ